MTTRNVAAARTEYRTLRAEYVSIMGRLEHDRDEADVAADFDAAAGDLGRPDRGRMLPEHWLEGGRVALNLAKDALRASLPGREGYYC